MTWQQQFRNDLDRLAQTPLHYAIVQDDGRTQAVVAAFASRKAAERALAEAVKTAAESTEWEVWHAPTAWALGETIRGKAKPRRRPRTQALCACGHAFHDHYEHGRRYCAHRCGCKSYYRMPGGESGV